MKIVGGLAEGVGSYLLPCGVHQEDLNLPFAHREALLAGILVSIQRYIGARKSRLRRGLHGVLLSDELHLTRDLVL